MPSSSPRPFRGPFDYAVPQGLDPQPGDIVLIPLNRREEIGVVWDTTPTPPASEPPPRNNFENPVGDNRLRDITAILETPPLPETLRPLRRLGRRLHPRLPR